MKTHFRKNIDSWRRDYNREYFWISTQDPYYIWLRETMLQQTRVNQAAAYFNSFIKSYPTVHDLAAADEDDIMKLWQGLGYYSRARNLHTTAKHIVEEFNGIFPQDYDSLLALKGIGDYTASAIMSFSFGKPYVTMDGNVIRLFARYFGINGDVSRKAVKDEILRLANEMMHSFDPSVFNQAIMDFGAEICKWRSPECGNCPLNEKCIAFNKGIVDQLPVKKKKALKRKRYFNFLVIRSNDKFVIEKRSDNDIWKGLFQFPLIESNKVLAYEEIKSKLTEELKLKETDIKVNEEHQEYKQVLSHQMIYARYWTIESYKDYKSRNCISVDKLTLSLYAYPKVIDCYLKDNILI
ncbi:MAG: A/G-specific adenine glycosylase [Chitinophagales bacterium]|nr:A/G-specific adenine glycosylase [Chitinophagales bacterium]